MSMYALSMAKLLPLRPSPSKVVARAEQLKALGDPTRLNLILTVALSENEESCICDLTPNTNLVQSTVSHHMKILVDAGLLTRSQRGKWAFFSLTKDAQDLLKILL